MRSLRQGLAGVGVVAGVMVLAACSTSVAPSTAAPTAVATATATVTATAAPTTTASSTSTAASTPAPSSAATGAGGAGSDPNRPAGQCADRDLKVSVRGYGTSAGHVYSQFVFTNTGAHACQLRGYPGVSVVGHDTGDQIGVPASKNAHSALKTVTLPPGTGEATAILQAVSIGSNGGPLGSACHTSSADGYRIYLPHSTEAVFVRQSGIRACTSTTVWMTIAPVTDTTK